MTTFNMMIGLPYSGKSYFVNKYKAENDIYISSDDIRKELYGDESDQTNPNKVFDIMYKRTCKTLSENKSVWYDATNIKSKYRIHLLNNLKHKFNDVYYKCYVMCTPFKILLIRQQNRDRFVPTTVIDKMLRQFEVPMHYEGWNEIELVRMSDIITRFNADRYLETNKNVAHDNPHHTLNIFEHMQLASNSYHEDMVKENNVEEHIIYNTLKYHDIGKYYCKTFVDAKGIKSNIAHYYNHENVGAYYILTSNIINSDYALLIIAWLINNHMKFYTNNISNWINKYNIPQSLIDKLEIVHKYDMEAH